MLRGSGGGGVVALQERLTRVGSIPLLEIDGIFGTQTDEAVRFFQRSHRLVVDGIVGPETDAMLDREVTQHGDADPAAHSRRPCHTPDEPGPDESAREDAKPEAAESSRPSSLPGSESGAGQKAKAASAVQANPTGPAPDLVVQLTDEAPPAPGGQDARVSQALAQAAGGATPLKVASPEALSAELKRRGRIGRLIIISHGLDSGTVRFNLSGVRDVTLTDLAARLAKSGASVDQVIFRGCSIGNDPKGLEDVRKAVNGSVAERTNCHLYSKRAGPVTILAPPAKKGVPPQRIVVDSEQRFQDLRPNDKPVYHRTLRQLLSETGRPECLVNKPAGRTTASLSDAELRAIAMRIADASSRSSPRRAASASTACNSGARATGAFRPCTGALDAGAIGEQAGAAVTLPPRSGRG